MSKIGKALKAIWWILKKPVLLNRVLTDEDNWLSYVEKKHNMSGGLPVVDMDQLIAAGPVELGPMTLLDGGSMPSDMLLLAGLAERIKNCAYFEIGTWRGESVATISPRSSTCHTLCLSDREMAHMGMHPRTIESHGLFSKDLQNVIQLRGDSRTFDFAQLDRKFDLIFIDGDHHYDFVKSDTENIFRHLVHDESIVVWHDYGFQADQIRYEVMAAILDGVGSKLAPLLYHVAHTKCAIYTGKKMSAVSVDFPIVPKAYFNITISRRSNK